MLFPEPETRFRKKYLPVSQNRGHQESTTGTREHRSTVVKPREAKSFETPQNCPVLVSSDLTLQAPKEAFSLVDR